MIQIRILMPLIMVLGTFMAPANIRGADPVRIGILGIDNFGSVAYTEFLNKPNATGIFAGVIISATRYAY